MNCRRRAIAVHVLLVLASMGGDSSAEHASQPSRFHRGTVIAHLEEDEKIQESSGLAVSRVAPGRFWTHNDSGDKPRLFAFNDRGKHLGTSKIDGASAKDWEDLASCIIDRKPYLVIGDVGDNGLRRKSYKIYIVAEPHDPKQDTKPQIVVKFTYEDGRQNCEAIAVDVPHRQILLAVKSVSLSSHIYALPWPAKSTDEAVAKKVGIVAIPVITGMDVSADGLHAAFTTYLDGYELHRRPTESWTAALRRQPSPLIIPPRKQGESICYGPAGQNLFLTSERTPTPLLRLQLIRKETKKNVRSGTEVPHP